MTSFKNIYDCFFSKITDDMYLELNEQDTLKECKSILLNSISLFEFPRFDLYNYNVEEAKFNFDLSAEEINIFATLMVITWLDRQIDSVEYTRMKYSGNDFKFTSQANHLGKLLSLKENKEKENTHIQRLYKRRRSESTDSNKSNWRVFAPED